MDIDTVIEIENLKKRYKLGTIGGGTLRGEIQSRLALMRGKEDPNSIIGQSGNYNKIFWTLKGVDFKVKRGERIGIIGHNGAGKSTLLKILSRITAPTEGKIRIRGRIASMLEVGTGFHGELTGRENIYLNAAILGMTKSEVDEKIDDIIAFSECEDFIDTPVKRYSSGMYVKLAFSVAAHLDSEIMIMDEVLAVGDVSFQNKCLKKMREIAENENRTILYVSHNMATIRKLCDRCVVLDHGNIVFEGKPDDAIQIYLSRDTEQDIFNYFYGDKRSNEIARIWSVEILNKKKFYLPEDKIRLSVKIKAFENESDVSIRVFYRYPDTSTIGTFFSNDFSIKENHLYNFEFELPLNIVPEGEFNIKSILSKRVNQNQFNNLSQIDFAEYFEMKSNTSDYNNLKWREAWRANLGNIEFKKIEES